MQSTNSFHGLCSREVSKGLLPGSLNIWLIFNITFSSSSPVVIMRKLHYIINNTEHLKCLIIPMQSR